MVELLSRSLSVPLGCVYTIYATTFAVLALLLTYIKNHGEMANISKYKLGNIWPVKRSVDLAVFFILAVQVIALCIITADLTGPSGFYFALKVCLIFSWLSFLMLVVIFKIVVCVAKHAFDYLEQNTG